MKKSFILILGLATLIVLGGCRDNSNDPIDICTESNGIPFDNVKVIDSTIFLNTVELNSTHHQMSFNSSVQKIEEGDVLVFDSSPAYPGGMTRKVQQVTESNGTILAVATIASLGEIFKELQLCHHTTLKPEKIVHTNLEEDQLGSYNGELDSKHSLYDFTYKLEENFADDEVTLTGKIHFSLDYDIAIKTKTTCTWSDGCHLKIHSGSKFTIDPEVYTSLTLTAEREYSKKESKTLYSVNFEPITIFVASIPVVIVPELYIIGGIDGEMDASAQTGIWAKAEGAIGIKYHGEEYGGWKPVEYIGHSFGDEPLTIDASARAKAYVGPKVKLKLYDITGPYADLYAYAQLDADINDDPWWTLHAGIESYGGFKMRILHHTLANVHKTIYTKDFIVLEADGSFP